MVSVHLGGTDSDDAGNPRINVTGWHQAPF